MGLAIQREFAIGSAIFFCIAALIGDTSGAFADCLSRCLGSCESYDSNNQYEVARCGGKMGQCGAVCAGKGSHNYGAIAYSARTGATGWSNKYDTREDAESAALDQCQARASDCEIVVWVDSTCGAVAVGDDKVPQWGLGETARSAEFAAMRNCQKAGGNNCAVKERVCSRGDAD